MSSIIETFFEYLFGLHLFELLKNAKKYILVLIVLALNVIFTVCWVIPLATEAVHKVNELTGYYDERFPEIEISTARVSYAGTDIPVIITLPHGGNAVFDTTGVYTSVEEFPEGSILFTESAVQWRDSEGVEVAHFKDVKTVQPILITHANIKTLKNALLGWGIVLVSVLAYMFFCCILFFVIALGSGFCVLFDSLRNGPMQPGDSFTLAVCALTPFVVFLSAAFLFDIRVRGLWPVLTIAYMAVLAVNMILIDKDTKGRIFHDTESR